MAQNRYLNIYLAVLLFFLVCYRALYQYIHIDGDGRIVTSTAVLSLVYLGLYKKYIKESLLSFPVLIWAFLMTYQIVHAIIANTYDPRYNQIIVTLQELGIMVITAHLFCSNKKMTFWTLLTALLVYLYVAYLFCSTEEESSGGRLTGFIYTTQLGQLSGFTCIVISLFIYYRKKPLIYIVLYLLPCIILLLTQSRNGLWPVLFSFLILLYPQLIKIKWTNLLVYGLGIYVGLMYFLSTSFFERLTTSKDSYAATGIFYTGTVLDDIFADRAIYYFLGYFDFLENPIFGIGLFNFADYNHFEYMLHSEILVHVVEGGLVGAILYILFIGYFFKNLLAHYTFKDISRNCMIFAFLPLFIISFTARIYQYPFFFVVYGLLLGYILQNKKSLR